ncbi:hypothetical protein F5883DRAFT_430874 [Diaporthe sp. PMI_573]|nr:hypothetical protein F5883DRAFT_430874 [Diaporthaceae sp. PMI_573]
MDSTTTAWDRWRASVRLLILQALLEDGCSLAELATVSREWQKVIEQHNFARIKVTPPRLADFSSMIRRNRSQVNYIWLCVELEHYSSLKAYSGNSRFISQRDLSLVAKAIRTLFTELSKWEPSSELLLDISIHSPSDSDYLLKYLTFGPDIPSNECLGLGDVDYTDKSGHDWNNWSAAGKADKAIKKALSTIYLHDSSPDDEVFEREVEWWDRLPQVPAVTGLLLRQQTRRRWLSSTLQEMFAHFPRLQEVFYEPWRLPYRGSQVHADQDYDFLIDSLTRQSVRKLTIFENYNQHYSRLTPGYNHTRVSDKALNRTAAWASRELEHFSASFLIDAGLFFASCRPSWTWTNLTSLSLTSPLLAPKAAQADIVKMLNSAAAVACRMPELKTMELWNGRKTLATLFKYQSRHATITWRSTWDFALLPLVIPAWEGVARKYGAGELVVRKEMLNVRADIKSHGDAIHYLELSHPVVRPISLQQIRTENKVHSIWEEMRKVKDRQDELGSN